MRHPLMRLLAASFAAATSLAAAAPPAPADQTRTLYFSATDSKGVPVTDLTAADLTVKEGGRDRAVASVTAATAPMEIAILVDDGGTGGYQGAVAQLLEATLARAQVSIRLFTPQALTVVDYTQDGSALKTALGRIGPRGRVQPDSDQLPEAISSAARELQQRKAARPVIVVLTVFGEDGRADNPDATLERLIETGSMLNVISVTNAPVGRILSDGPKFSGGRSDVISGSAAIAAAVTKLVNHLRSQYVLSYTLPDGVKPNDRVSVATSRKGVSVTAPSRLASR